MKSYSAAKKIISVILLTGLLSFVYAADVTVTSVCADIASNPVTKGDFTQAKTVSTAKGNRTLTSKGTFLFCVQGIIWDTVKPFPSKMIITPTKIIQTNASGDSSVIEAKDNPSFAGIAAGITAIFAGDISQIEQNFKMAFNATGNEWTIQLTPKNETFAKAMHQITLSGTTGSTGKALLTKIEMLERAGGTITYTFENETFHKELSADEKSYFAQ